MEQNFCQSINRCRRDRKSCRVYRTERSSARRTWEQRWKIMANNSRKNQCQPEAELDEEMRGLQAGDEKETQQRISDQWIRLSCAVSSRQEQIWPGSRLCVYTVNSGKRMEHSISWRQSLQCVPEGVAPLPSGLLCSGKFPTPRGKALPRGCRPARISLT